MALYHLLVLFTISTKLAGVVADCTCADIDNKGKLTCTTEVIPKGAVKGCKDDLKTLILAKGVTKVGIRAFEDCKKLETLTISPTVELIGEKAFKDCKLMKSVKIEPRIELLEGPPKTNITCSIKEFGKESFKNAGKDLREEYPTSPGFPLDLSECDQLAKFGESSFEESNVGMLKLPQNQLIEGALRIMSGIPYDRFAHCNIESFGDKAFYGATNLVGEVCVDDFPPSPSTSTIVNKYQMYKDLVNQCLDVAFCTKLKTIGKEAFENTKVKMYVVSSLARSLQIGKYAFPSKDRGSPYTTMKANRLATEFPFPVVTDPRPWNDPAAGRRLQTDNATEEFDTDVVDDESEWDEVYVRLSDVLQQPPTCDDPKDDGLSLGEKIIIGLGAPTLALTLGIGAVAVYMLVNSKQNMGDKNP